MSLSIRRGDAAPQIVAAGAALRVGNGSSRDCINPPTDQERPKTPPEIQKYRQTYWNEPGKRVIHYGLAGDSSPVGPDHIFGVKPDRSGPKASELVNPPQKSELETYVEETKERQYKSKTRQLGTRYTHGHVLPEHVRSPDYRFGVTSEKNPIGAKDVLFPEDRPEDGSPEARELYKRTHGNFEPGEQRRRDYDWRATAVRDPDHFRFGVADPHREMDGARKCLQPVHDSPGAPATIVHKTAHDVQRFQSKPLGKSRIVGCGNTDLPPDFTYGKPSAFTASEPEPGAGKIIFGMYTPEQQQPDMDLGRSIKPGRRNFTETDRAFGVPSIRTDVRAPKNKSVASTQAYGNEPTATALLRPFKYAAHGVHDEDFLAPYPREELWDLFSAAGTDISRDEFDAAFAVAAEGTADARVSIDRLRQAIVHLALQQ